MEFVIIYSLIFIILIGLTTSQIHNVCEICSCNNLNKSISVDCNSKNFSNLTNIIFNSSIETLSLVNNSLTLKSIDDLTKINNITSLKTLILSNNPLETIPELSLSQLVNLELENTYLKTVIFPKSYANMNKLQSIVLSNNKLIRITSDNFKYLTSVKQLILDNTQLYYIEQNTFISLSKTLQSLSFVSNSLKSAEFLSTLSNIESINFDKNKFKQLPKEIIQLNRTKSFFFRHNYIDIIDELSPLHYWTKTNQNDMVIYLNNNPFDCCRSRWFIHYLNNRKNLVKDSFNLTCILPKTLTDKRLVDLHIDLIDCSNGPFYPRKIYLSKVVLIFICLSSVVIFIVSVVGATLYRGDKVDHRRRRNYRTLQGDNSLA